MNSDPYNFDGLINYNVPTAVAVLVKQNWDTRWRVIDVSTLLKPGDQWLYSYSGGNLVWVPYTSGVGCGGYAGEIARRPLAVEGEEASMRERSPDVDDFLARHHHPKKLSQEEREAEREKAAQMLFFFGVKGK